MKGFLGLSALSNPITWLYVSLRGIRPLFCLQVMLDGSRDSVLIVSVIVVQALTMDSGGLGSAAVA